MILGSMPLYESCFSDAVNTLKHDCYCSELFHVTGVVVYEYELKIGWGKSVALPSQALPAPPPGHMAIRSKEVYDMFL